MYDLASFIANFVRPELLLVFIISGYLTFFLFFHNTSTKEKIKEVEVLFIVITLGFLFNMLWTISILPIHIPLIIFTNAPLPSWIINYFLILFLGIILLYKLTDEGFWKITTAMYRLKITSYSLIILIYTIFLALCTSIYLSAIIQKFYVESIFNYYNYIISSFLFLYSTFFIMSTVFDFGKNIETDIKKHKKFFTLPIIIFLISFLAFSSFAFPSVNFEKPDLGFVRIECEDIDCNYLDLDERFSREIKIAPRLITFLHLPINGTEISPDKYKDDSIEWRTKENNLEINLSSFGRPTNFSIYYHNRNIDIVRIGYYQILENEYYKINISSIRVENINNISIQMENKQNIDIEMDVAFWIDNENCTLIDPKEGRIDGRGFLWFSDTNRGKRLEFDLRFTEHENKTYSASILCVH